MGNGEWGIGWFSRVERVERVEFLHVSTRLIILRSVAKIIAGYLKL